MGEHPAKGDLAFLLSSGDRGTGTVLVLLGLPWLSAVGSPGICNVAFSLLKLCQGLQESSGTALHHP